jgi:hypothetical protein
VKISKPPKPGRPKIKIAAIPNTNLREIPPTHPGEVLKEDFMPDYGLTAATLADLMILNAQ